MYFIVYIYIISICVLFADCFPAPEPNVNPVSLSSRWLAFADSKVIIILW